MATPHGALLVGSVNSPDAETTMRTAAGKLRDHLKRIPDGEVGERFHWIMFQAGRLAQAEGIDRVGDEPIYLRDVDSRPVRVREGVRAEDLRLPPLGYAEAALASYEVFARLRDEGVIPSATRFQVSLPTPLAVVGAYFLPDQHAMMEPVYSAALYAELDAILAGIPHQDLAIQWDCAVEFQVIEQVGYRERSRGVIQPWWGDLWTGLVERAAEQAAAVPANVEVRFHLCYGDASEKHFVEPADTANLVRFANHLFESAPRTITWIHLPVPIERTDDEYYAPLGDLRLPEQTELYLGLVHREDGVAGASRRVAAASAFATQFGVATECGMGRGPASATDEVLDVHRHLARPWGT